MLSIRFDSNREWWVSGRTFERLFQTALGNGSLPANLGDWLHVADANGGFDVSEMAPGEARDLITALCSTAEHEVQRLWHADEATDDGSYRVSLKKLLDLKLLTLNVATNRVTSISYNLVVQYLMGIFTTHFENPEDPFSAPQQLDQAVEQFRLQANQNGDLPYLRVALEHILSNPDLDSKIWWDISFNDDYSFEPAEARAILLYVYQKVYPGINLPTAVNCPKVSWLRGMEWQDWHKQKASLNPHLQI